MKEEEEGRLPADSVELRVKGPSGQDEERERKGGAAPWGAGAGGPGSIGAGRSIVGASARVPGSSLQILLDAFTRATGLGTILATKAGIVALLAAGLTAAAGISFMVQRSSSAPELGPGVFSFAKGGPGPAQQARAEAEKTARQAGDGISSIDYFRQANPTVEGPPPAEETAPADAAAQAPAVPDNAGGPAAASDAPKPRMVTTPFGSTTGGGGRSAPGGAPAPAGGASAGGELQALKASAPGRSSALPGGSRASYSASKRPSQLGSRGALAQARAAQRLSQSANRMGRADSAASTASKPFDAGAPAGAIGGSGIGGGGLGTGGQGVQAGAKSPNPSNDVRQTPPPPPVGEAENKTPWQGLLYAAIGALVLGLALLIIAQILANKAKANPLLAPELLPIVKMLAVGAGLLGITALGLGAMIMSQFGQKAQGLMFIVSGGLMAAMAIKVFIDANAAGKTEAGIAGAQADAKTATDAGTASQVDPPAN